MYVHVHQISNVSNGTFTLQGERRTPVQNYFEINAYM